MAGLLAPAAQAAKPPPLTYGITTATTPLTPTVQTKARLTGAGAEKIFLAVPKVHDWLKRYPPKPPVDASYANGSWTVNVFSGQAGEIASGTVDDVTGAVLTAYTGPAVAWGMARGGPGAFGGKEINSYSVWLMFCAVFLVGLVDWRRPFSLRTVDLLMMLSFSLSLWFFNRANIFAAMPLAYPGMAWLLARCVWIGRRDRPPRGSSVWPVWLLVGATVFLVGFRIGLNVQDSNVIDVGLSGVIGAERISVGQDPYGNFPIEGNRPACGPADASGEVRDRIQTNGRCEAADAQGDTYGPVSYLAYLPGYWVFGWSGKWDSLPTAHATSILWDTLCLIGLWLVGLRFGGPRLAAMLAFGWAAWPFSQYSSMSNTNDMIQPALLVWAFWFLTSPALRGAFAALSALVKFAPLIGAPALVGLPRRARQPLAEAPSSPEPRLRGRPRSSCSSSTGTPLARRGRVLPREPSATSSAAPRRSRSAGLAPVPRRRGYPTCTSSSGSAPGRARRGALAALPLARAAASALQIAAFTEALLIEFEVVLTHWSWLYLPWFFPFVAFAVTGAADRGSACGGDRSRTRP